MAKKETKISEPVVEVPKVAPEPAIVTAAPTQTQLVTTKGVKTPRTYKTKQMSTVAKKAVIVFAHPNNEDSKEKLMLDAAKAGFDRKGKSYDIIDLYAEKYDPVYHGKELALYNRGYTTEELPNKYAEMLKQCDELVIITNITLLGVPAILKGFFDKVLMSNHGFWTVMQPTFVFPFLWGTTTWIKKASVFTTSVESNIWNWKHGHNAASHMLKQGTLKACRIRRAQVFNLGKSESVSERKMAKHCKHVKRICARELYK